MEHAEMPIGQKKGFIGDGKAGVAIEYALIAGFLSLVIIVVVFWVGDEVTSMFTDALNSFRAMRTRA